jgi:hypothetical protein
MWASKLIPLLLSVSLLCPNVASFPAPQAPSNDVNIEQISAAPASANPAPVIAPTPIPEAIITSESQKQPSDSNSDSGSVSAEVVHLAPGPTATTEEPPHSTDHISVQTITQSDKTIQMYVFFQFHSAKQATNFPLVQRSLPRHLILVPLDLSTLN